MAGTRIQKKNDPVVGIVIPVYNGEPEILEECIATSCNQTYKRKEVIAVDDCSNEETKKHLQKLSKKYDFILINNKVNLGMAGSMNEGIKRSKAKYVIMLPQDCIPYSKNWLSELVSLAENNDVIGICSRVLNDPDIWQQQEQLIKDLTIAKQKHYYAFDEKGSLYVKKALEKVGYFDAKNFRLGGEDFDMYYKFSKMGKILWDIKPYIIHKHFFNRQKYKSTSSMYAYAYGRLFRTYNVKLHRWFRGLVLKNMFPLWGILKGLKTKTTGSKLDMIKFCIELNWLYTKNFFKGWFHKQWKS